MANIAEKTPRKRGRPRQYTDGYDKFLTGYGITAGLTRRSHTDAFYRLKAMSQLHPEKDPLFAWLWCDGGPNGHPKKHVRRTILAELGRMDDEADREAIARELCEQQPTTRDAVAMIRASRLGQPPGTPEQLSEALRTTVDAYLKSHADMGWDDVRHALEYLMDDLDLIESESN
jgi:hypothetical protein